MTGRSPVAAPTVIERVEVALVGSEARPVSAELIHELTEALTATGNYLGAASRMLEVRGYPPEDRLRDALQKGMAQFDRLAEVIRQLGAALSRGR